MLLKPKRKFNWGRIWLWLSIISDWGTRTLSLLWLLFKMLMILWWFYDDDHDVDKDKGNNLSKASKYFWFLISKNIFIECWLSLISVKPLKYFSHSSQSPARIFSSNYLKLNKRPYSCSNLDTCTQKTQTKIHFSNINLPFLVVIHHACKQKI